MKKLLIITLICFCSFLHASLREDSSLGTFVDRGYRSISNYYDHNEWIIGLEDGSFWKIQVLKEKRKKTWYEWWNDITPKEWKIGNEYYFDPQEWSGNFEVQIYRKKSKLFPEASHVLINETTGQKAFAQFIPFGSKYIPSLAFAEQFFHHPDGSTEKITCKIRSLSSALKNIVILGDNSCWKLFPFNQNSRSWTQWLQGRQVDQPDPMFVFNISDWDLKDQIQVYFLEEDASLSAKYDPNWRLNKFHKKGVFLLENRTKKHLVYAKEIGLNELVTGFKNYADLRYNRGYSRGYRVGLDERTLKLDKKYKEMGKKIFDEGFAKGFEKGLKEIKKVPPRPPAYNPAYAEPSAPLYEG